MRNFSLFVVVMLIMVGLGEFVVRLVLPAPGLSPFPPNQSRDMLIEHPVRSYTYNPGFRGTAHQPPHEVEVRINSLGMRDNELAPDEQIDFLAIGDSFTAGALVSADEAWPEQLEEALNQARPENDPVRVLNAGVSGYNMRQIRLAGEELLSLSPAAIIVGAYPAVSSRLIDPFVWADGFSARQSKAGNLKTSDEGFLLATPNRYLSNEAQFWLYENFYFGGWLWVAVSPLVASNDSAPRFPERGLTAMFLDELEQLHAATLAADVPLIVFLIAHQQQDGTFSKAIYGYNAAVARFCEERQIPVFDSLDVLASYPVDGPEFRAGGTDFHWSPLGHKLAARGLADYLLGGYMQSE